MPLQRAIYGVLFDALFNALETNRSKPKSLRRIGPHADEIFLCVNKALRYVLRTENLPYFDTCKRSTYSILRILINVLLYRSHHPFCIIYTYNTIEMPKL